VRGLSGIAVLALASAALLVPSGAAGRVGELPSTGTAIAIAAGSSHSCLVTSARGVKCWGQNTFGQLGNGTTTDSLTPVDVSGLTSGVVSISVGGYHSCATTATGALKCWGRNDHGQLGDGTTTDRSAPVTVAGLSTGVVAVSAGYLHTCARTTADGVKCWGENVYGQLGDGSNMERDAPVDVSGLTSGVTAIATGQYHSCAVTSAGGAKCWGNNDSGQLGDGTRSNTRNLPVDVVGLSGAARLAAGFSHTCALTSTGGAKCWGDNSAGQVGDGTTEARLTPVGVSGLASGVAAIALGGSHSCAVTNAGAAKCWGRNVNGELGDGSTTDRHTDVDVSGLAAGVTAVAGGEHHTCAVLASGVAQCWGLNDRGQLGDGTVAERHEPVDVVGFEGPRTLTVSTAGTGAGTVVSTPAGIDCRSTCTHTFAFGTSIALTATADPGSQFTGWSGDCGGTGPCSFTMSANHSAVATFKQTAKCVVPRVVGRGLAVAKRRIVRAHCRVGRVVYVFSTHRQFRRVVRQSPRPGRRYAPGRKVNLRVGKGPHRR
jgi:alpha-tubulin suppressor-like RCC1 family protein